MLRSNESLEEVPGTLQGQEDEASRKEGDVEGECSDGAHFVLDHASTIGPDCGQLNTRLPEASGRSRSLLPESTPGRSRSHPYPRPDAATGSHPPGCQP